MRHARLLLLALPVVLLGCASGMGEEPEGFYSENREYARVYDATYQVLARHFQVHTSRHTANQQDIIAVSRVNTQGTDQLRFKVVARVVFDDDDRLAPQITVLHQVDISDVVPNNRSVAQPNHRWAQSSRNHEMEAQLLNEVDELLYGPGVHPDKFMRNPLKQ